jgi:hypothetical protein
LFSAAQPGERNAAGQGENTSTRPVVNALMPNHRCGQRSVPGGARSSARDRLIAEDAVRNAERLNIRVLEIDGSRDGSERE